MNTKDQNSLPQVRRETVYYILAVYLLKIRILEKKKAEKKAWGIQRENDTLNMMVRIGFTEVVCKPRPGKSERTSHK